jgi:glycosyltransferase involved in cell wall biosynthesis
MILHTLKNKKMISNKPTLILLVNYLPHYRIPIINKLGNYFDLTVAHYGKEIVNENLNFKQKLINAISIGPFVFFKENIHKLVSGYDAVLSLSELRVIPNMLLGFRKKRKYALIYWGIGVSASYDKKFDHDQKLDWMRFSLMNKADSILFYSDYPIQRYIAFGINKEKLFVAQNTVEVTAQISIPYPKTYFLFVGTLYKVKKIYDLLEAYILFYQRNNNIPPLYIVGEGDERINIEFWIRNNDLSQKIILKGPINQQEELKEIYKGAIACISPGQAGLTVLNSMAYGVPFVTTPDAITGGEIFNIKDRINGLFYDGSIDSLSQLMEFLNANPQKVNELSINAQNYYFENRTADQMVQGFRDAIDYAILTRKNIQSVSK